MCFLCRPHVHGALRDTGELTKPLSHIFSHMGKAYGLKSIPSECPAGINYKLFQYS